MTAPIEDTTRDIARLGRDAYESKIRPQLRPEDNGRYVAIDVDTGEFETDADDYTANIRILARHPGARVWLTRAGYGAAYRIGRGAGWIR